MRTKREPTPGDRLQIYRKERGLSQSDLAGELGVTKTYLSNLENGWRAPGRDISALIEQVVGIAVSEWTGVARRSA